MVVADNGSADSTLTVRRVIRTSSSGRPAKLGVAGGINLARRDAGEATAVLVLNPDLVVEPGAIRTLLRRMVSSDAGIVVPQLLDEDGSVYTSLRVTDPAQCARRCSAGSVSRTAQAGSPRSTTRAQATAIRTRSTGPPGCPADSQRRREAAQRLGRGLLPVFGGDRLLPARPKGRYSLPG